MTLRVEPLVGAVGHMRILEITGDSGAPYRGAAVQFVDDDGRWVWQYANSPGRAFARYLGPALPVRDPGRVEWISATSGSRRSKLVSERVGEVWRRAMQVCPDGGEAWRVLWTDELRRALP